MKLNKLRELLSKDDTVLFVGSGLSLWSGLPSWGGLIEELALFVESNGESAELIRSEAKRGDLLQAASYGFHLLRKPQIGEFIRKACRYGEARPAQIHSKVVSLGPNCFITTNYDNLLELSLAQWKGGEVFRTVTNRHLLETAEVVHARATNFVFKPHGDAGDADSVILTREQYRLLLPQGERHAALESLKMLLASRPVVYIGFGLRDPDFIYIRDIIHNIYQGGERDHYAIISDVCDQEIAYWREEYGIHLVGYDTVEDGVGGRSHENLVGILDALLVLPNCVRQPSSVFNIEDSEFQLSLARYSARLMRATRASKEFKLMVSSKGEETRHGFIQTLNRFDRRAVSLFLEHGPERAILIGPPGAGKSYSLRSAAANLASKVNDACLSESLSCDAVIPVIADLKLYRGDLVELLSQTLPSGLPLHLLTKNFKVRVFLDSFNEMPREYFEGAYEADFSFFMSEFNAEIVIGSRTDDGLEKLGLPVYSLDLIYEEDVRAGLEGLDIAIGGRFSSEMVSLLQRPFFYQYVASGTVSLSSNAHPRDFYKSIFEGVNTRIAKRYGVDIDIERPLSAVAYHSLSKGEEVFLLSSLTNSISAELASIGCSSIETTDLANWLVSESIIIPYSGKRASFIHQSVTEYLAAKELAKLYKASPGILKSKLALTRWDQAIFLTLSFLDEAVAEDFLDTIIDVDFQLALGSSKYLEFNRDAVVSRLLEHLVERCNQGFGQVFSYSRLLKKNIPISDCHEPFLRALLQKKGLIGGAAAACLVELTKGLVKREFIELIFKYREDFNFCSALAESVSDYIESSDIPEIVAGINAIDVYPEVLKDIQGLFTACTGLFENFDLSLILEELCPSGNLKDLTLLQVWVLCDVICGRRSSESLDLAADLILAGFERATIPFFFIANYRRKKGGVSFDSLNVEHVSAIVSFVEASTFSIESWPIRALRCVCENRPDLASRVEVMIDDKPPMLKLVYAYCSLGPSHQRVFGAIEEVLLEESQGMKYQAFEYFHQMNIDWAGRDSVYSDILRTKNISLLKGLMGGSIPVTANGLGNIDVGPIASWLEWFAILESEDESDLVLKLSSVFAQKLSQQGVREIINEFNNPASKYREILARDVLPFVGDISTDSFSESAIMYLLDSLKTRKTFSRYNQHLLSLAATEQFVEDRLLPLLYKSRKSVVGSLNEILRDAGARHGRRYLNIS